MKLEITRDSSRDAVFVAIIVRVFTGVAISLPIHNGAWLAALLGGLFALPGLIGLWRSSTTIAFQAKFVRVPLCLFFLTASVLDSTHMLRCLTDSASYLALDQLPPPILLIPLGAAIGWCVFKNGDAIGYSATIWRKILPVFLLIVLALQFRSLRPAWMFPIMDGDARTLLSVSIRVSAWTLIPASGFMLAEGSEQPDSLRSLSVTWLMATATATLLVILWQMMAPKLLCSYVDTRVGRLDVFLTNGRAPLYMQLPLIVVWFIGLLQTLCFESFTAAALIQRLFRGLNGRVAATVGVATIVLATLLPDTGLTNTQLGGTIIFCAGMVLFILMAFQSTHEKGVAGCAKP